MRGYQARAHVGRGSLCVVLFTDWGCDGRRVSSLPRIPAQQRPPCLGSLPPGRVSRFQDVVSTGMISISSSTRLSVNGGRRKALVGQITPDERIDRSGPPGLAPVCQEIADRQSPRLLPQHCDIGQAVAAQRHRRRQVRHDLPGSWTALGAQLVDDLSHAPDLPATAAPGREFRSARERPTHTAAAPRARTPAAELQSR